jgi:hypothetical protein
VRVTPPQPLRSSEEDGPHKPDRDGSTPSAASMIRSRLAAGHATLTRGTKVAGWGPPHPARLAGSAGSATIPSSGTARGASGLVIAPARQAGPGEGRLRFAPSFSTDSVHFVDSVRSETILAPRTQADVAQLGEAARSDRARCPFESDRRYHVTVVEQEYTAG